jgi:hypothetical protein
MSQQLMVCVACREDPDADPFIVPHDEIGVEVMKAHLNEKHGANL